MIDGSKVKVTDGGEGLAKRKGAAARRGLKEAWSKAAARWTRTFGWRREVAAGEICWVNRKSSPARDGPRKHSPAGKNKNESAQLFSWLEVVGHFLPARDDGAQGRTAKIP
jgi:hypothetical protein